MKINFFGIVGVAWVAFWFTIVWKNIGALRCVEPYILDWQTALTVVFTMVFPLVVGYLAGKCD
jgi:hypothetical protein